MSITNKEKHFIVTNTLCNDENPDACTIEAVFSHNEYQINWQELKNNDNWIMGWK